jgi:hypothetical protein
MLAFVFLIKFNHVMLTQIIWWAGVILEVVLLWRAARGRLLRRFPVFYTYILFVLVETLFLFGVYHGAPGRYAISYWVCQFGALILGSLVLLEVCRVALRQYPGAARVTRNLLLFVFCLALAKAIVNQSFGAVWWPAATTAELERNLRVVQACALLAIFVALIFYDIPRDRNWKGILAGYGLFVALSIAQLSLLTHLGTSFHRLWSYIEPFSYLTVLVIWTVCLWSPARERSRALGPEVARLDHGDLVSRTKEHLQDIRIGLPGTTRR